MVNDNTTTITEDESDKIKDTKLKQKKLLEMKKMQLQMITKQLAANKESDPN